MVMENLDSSRPVRRLGFKEIVPGVADSDQASEPNVPKYDLGQRIMANQRRVVAATRKRPGQQKAEPALELSSGSSPVGRLCETAVDTDGVSQRRPIDALQSPTPSAMNRPRTSGKIWHPVMTEAQRQVIAQIVARDIKRLCRGERIF